MSNATNTMNRRATFIADRLGLDPATAEIVVVKMTGALTSWGCESQVLEVADYIAKFCITSEVAR